MCSSMPAPHDRVFGRCVRCSGLPPSSEWDTLVENVERMLSLRNTAKGTWKIVASRWYRQGVDINAVEKDRVEGIVVDYLVKRKFLTRGDNTTGGPTMSRPPAIK